jgi:hypothetical protein
LNEIAELSSRANDFLSRVRAHPGFTGKGLDTANLETFT